MEARARRLDSSDVEYLSISKFEHISIVQAFLNEVIEEEDGDAHLGLSSVRDYEGFDLSSVLLFIYPWSNFIEWLKKTDLEKLGARMQSDYDVGHGNLIQFLQMLRNKEWAEYTHKDMIEFEFTYD